MSDGSGRALAQVYSKAVTLDAVHARGWAADDLRDLDVPLMPYRDFASYQEAQAIAARDLPLGTTVSWTPCDGRLFGGFVVGRENVAPPLGGLMPAFILWPDFSELYVETRDQLVDALRDRLDWLVALGLEDGVDAKRLAAGRVAMLRALERVAAGERFTIEARGPVFEGRCAASVEPVAGMRWDGFRAGWDEPAEPADKRRHPIHYDYAGAFQELWRDAVRSGISARSTRRPGRSAS
jgi:hypothetical protein